MTTEQQLEILEQYKKWIFKLSFKYGAMSNNYLEPEDLQSIGQMAAIEAYGKFDPYNKKGAKIGTYIMNHIKYRIQSAIRDCGELNSSQQNAMIMISAMFKRLGTEDATYQEIAAHSREYYPKSSSYHWSDEQAKNYLELYNIKRYSTDFWTDQEDDGGRANKHELVSDANIEEELNARQEKKLLYDAIDMLKPQFRIVMLGRMEGKTLEEIGNELFVTRERIRQIEGLATPIVVRLAQSKRLLPGQSKHLDPKKIKRRAVPRRTKLESVTIKMKQAPCLMNNYKPEEIETILLPLPIINFDMEHGDMIFPEEYALAPTPFKILQYLKTNDGSNKSKVAQGVNITQKTLYNNLEVLYELNYITEDLEVLPRDEWCKPPKKIVVIDDTPEQSASEVIKDLVKVTQPEPIVVPLEHNNNVEDIHGKIYKLADDLGGRYEVYDPSIGKYTILKEKEIKRIF